MTLHCLIEKDGNLYSSLCLELDVASQGTTVDEAKQNLQEAVELYLESVYEAGDEREFIPRPAPPEEWLKFFKAEVAKLKSEMVNGRAHQPLIFEGAVYEPTAEITL
jgi:predicted RNase H-like HicB family nuclease